MRNKKYVYFSNIQNFRIGAPFRPLFEIENSNFLMTHESPIKMTTSQKNCIKFKLYLFWGEGEIGTFRPLSIKFISKTVKDRGNPLTYY